MDVHYLMAGLTEKAGYLPAAFYITTESCLRPSAMP
jgi:hypothetical protein